MSDWYLEAGGMYVIKGQRVFGRNQIIAPDDIHKVRERFNNTDCYVTAYMYNGAGQDNSFLYGPLYIDLDINIKGDFEFNKLKRDLSHIVTALNIHYKVPHDFIKIFFSGHKGFHITVPPEVFDIVPHKRLNEYFKYVAQNLNSYTLFKTMDVRIYDNKRLFRLENSIHGETGLYKVPVDYEFARTATYQEMLEYASQPREINYPEPKKIAEASKAFKEIIKECENAKVAYNKSSNSKIRANGKILPCIENVLKNGVSKGNRNNTTVIVASSLVQNGMDIAKVKETLLEWNSTHNSPKLSDRELLNTIDSAYKGVLAGKGYGCRAIKELDLCTPGECSIEKNKKQTS
jgi:hypothetical protein